MDSTREPLLYRNMVAKRIQDQFVGEVNTDPIIEEDALKKAMETGEVICLTEEGLKSYIRDVARISNELLKAGQIGQAEHQEAIEKAKRDVSKLQRTTITNKLGRKQTVYLRINKKTGNVSAKKEKPEESAKKKVNEKLTERVQNKLKEKVGDSGAGKKESGGNTGAKKDKGVKLNTSVRASFDDGEYATEQFVDVFGDIGLKTYALDDGSYIVAEGGIPLDRKGGVDMKWLDSARQKGTAFTFGSGDAEDVFDHAKDILSSYGVSVKDTSSSDMMSFQLSGTAKIPQPIKGSTSFRKEMNERNRGK
jgi:hypothetical protein